MLLYLIIINILGYFLYKMDKNYAINHKFRIDEKILLLIPIIGGAIGSYLSMYINHHKTRKWYFKLVIIFSLIIWIYLLIKYKMI